MTSYLARQLHHNKPHDVLKMLNSNSENPYLVWNNGTRSELTKFLEDQRDSAVRRGESDPGKTTSQTEFFKPSNIFQLSENCKYPNPKLP